MIYKTFYWQFTYSV